MSSPARVHALDDGADHATRLTRIIGNLTGWLGSFPAILISVALVVAWVVGGFFVHDHFDNTVYQLLINTGTTIITFLMVFIIQNTQNREGRAMQAKLDAHTAALETIAARLGVDSETPQVARLIGLEDAPERDIKHEQHDIRRVARHAGNGQGPA